VSGPGHRTNAKISDCGKAYDEPRERGECSESDEQREWCVHGGLRDLSLRERDGRDARTDETEVGPDDPLLVRLDAMRGGRPERDRQRKDRPYGQAVDPAEVTGVQLLDAERAERDPIHVDEPDPAEAAVQQVALAAAQDVVAAEHHREGRTGGVRGEKDRPAVHPHASS